MKLLLGIPTGGNPAEPFVKSLHQLKLPPAITEIEHKTTVGNFVPAQRELLAGYALHRNADFLLMADDDMVVPSDAVGKLLEPFEDPRVGIVGALCYSRDGIRPMAVDDWNAADTTSAAIPAFDDRTPVEVDGVGFGLAMIRCKTLEVMSQPFFPAHIFIEQALARVRVCDEDFLFCRRLKDEGWKVFLHPGVRCGHFDRQSGQVFPLEWEDPGVSNTRRMLVRDADGTIAKRAFEPNLASAPETHVRADVEYVIVD